MNADPLALRKRKLAWHARRGLLELDCLIQPFMQQDFAQINADEVALLESLFAMEDPDLLALLMRPESALNLTAPEQRLIQKILTNSATF